MRSTGQADDAFALRGAALEDGPPSTQAKSAVALRSHALLGLLWCPPLPFSSTLPCPGTCLVCPLLLQKLGKLVLQEHQAERVLDNLEGC